MKTSTAVIRLVLRTNKTLADGTNPIMLRCSWHGDMKEVSTHFSCKPAQWDEKNERLRKNYPNYGTVNAILDKVKADAISRRNEYELAEEPYTPSMVLSSGNDKKTAQKSLKEVTEVYITDRGLRYNTSRVRRSAAKLFREFIGRDISVRDITSADVRRFATWLSCGRMASTVKTNLGCLQGILSYAVEKKMIPSNPFDGFLFQRKYKCVPKTGHIHYKTIEFIKDIMMEKLRCKPLLMLEEIDDDWILWFYMSIILLQGLAPADVLRLKRCDMTVKNINGKNFYCIDTQRVKTGVPVKIRIPQDDYSDAMIRPLMHINRSDYLFPIVEDGDNIDKKVAWVLKRCNKRLSSIFLLINVRIAKAGYPCPEVDRKLSMYSARHSYACMYMAKGGSPLALASLMGRSVNTLGTYVSLLSEESDLVNAVM